MVNNRVVYDCEPATVSTDHGQNADPVGVEVAMGNTTGPFLRTGAKVE